MTYLASGYLVGAARGLGDVPTVPVTVPINAQIAPPPGAVELTPYTPNVFLVPRPVAARLPGQGGGLFGLSLTPTTVALLAGGAAALLLGSRRRR